MSPVPSGLEGSGIVTHGTLHLRDDAPLSSGHTGETTETLAIPAVTQGPNDHTQARACRKKKTFSHQNMAFHVAPKSQSINHRSRIKQEFRNTVLESVRSGSNLGSATSLCDLEQRNHSKS